MIRGLIKVAKYDKTDYLPWYICTNAGIVLGYFRTKRLAERFATLVRQGGVNCYKYDPKGLYAGLIVSDNKVKDFIKPIVECETPEQAEKFKTLFWDAQGEFILADFSI